MPVSRSSSGLRRQLDVAVVGGGVLGLAATDALRRRGVDVHCFEGRPPGSGQSGGLTRTFRHRHDDEELVALAAESLRGWRDWEQRCGRRLIGPEGTAYLGMVAPDAAGLRRHGIEHRWVRPAEQDSVFGALAPVDGPLLSDPTAGAIRARRTIEVLAGWVRDRIIPADVHAVSVPGDGDGVELQTADAIYRARSVLVCAGTATPRLVAGVGLDLPLSCALHVRPHFRVRDGGHGEPLPCWVDRSGQFGETVYGSPIGRTGRYVVGLIGEGVDVPYPDAALPPGTEMEAYVRRVSDYVRAALPGLDPEPVGVRVCVMSKLPAGSDALGVWHTAGVGAVVGHNLFKMAPVLGELLADTALGGAVPARLRRLTDRALGVTAAAVRVAG